ncbi:uncharacterized protein bcl3 [Erpetoichthys calabaricus]|uniref:Uncharacterized protein n=1 Tax=Erpetoichthys calabaricus TaxID=27687 RepID=A0A8C4T9X0_ERPCA|nr:uncharacterized protein bcl3 [Erpetoichthys calabaricus]
MDGHQTNCSVPLDLSTQRKRDSGNLGINRTTGSNDMGCKPLSEEVKSKDKENLLGPQLRSTDLESYILINQSQASSCKMTVKTMPYEMNSGLICQNKSNKETFKGTTPPESPLSSTANAEQKLDMDNRQMTTHSLQSSEHLCKMEDSPILPIQEQTGSHSSDKPLFSLPLRKRPYTAVEDDPMEGTPLSQHKEETKSPSCAESNPQSKKVERGEIRSPKRERRTRDKQLSCSKNDPVLMAPQAVAIPVPIDDLPVQPFCTGYPVHYPAHMSRTPFVAAITHPNHPLPGRPLFNPVHSVLIPILSSHFPPVYAMENKQASDIAMATKQDEDGDTALHIAVVQEQKSVVQRLIQILLDGKKELDIYNNLRQTPLHLAVITQQPHMVHLLVSNGSDAMLSDRNLQTSIHLACEHNNFDCLQEILNQRWKHLNLEARNYEGLTPLHIAVNNGNKEIVTLLLDRGADIDAVDIKSGRSPLIHAVENNNTDTVKLLIESGSNVNTQTYSGNTALHSACGRGLLEITRILLKNGADSSIKNYHNDTPVMVAKNKKVIDVLRGKGIRNASNVKVPEAAPDPSTPCNSPNNPSTPMQSQDPTHTNGNSNQPFETASRHSSIPSHHQLAPTLVSSPQQAPTSQSNDRHSQIQRLSPIEMDYSPQSISAIPSSHWAQSPPFSSENLFYSDTSFSNLLYTQTLDPMCGKHPYICHPPAFIPLPPGDQTYFVHSSQTQNPLYSQIPHKYSQASSDKQGTSPQSEKDRPLSQSSSQSDISTISISSGSKGET